MFFNQVFARITYARHLLKPLLQQAPVCNIVLQQVGHVFVKFGYNPLSAVVPAAGFQFGFSLLSSTFKNIQALVPGGRFTKTTPNNNTGLLGEMLERLGQLYLLDKNYCKFELFNQTK